MDESELTKNGPLGGIQAVPSATRVEDLVSPATRRANLWLLTALIVFAVVFTVVVFLWMRGVVRANGGIVDPQRKTSLSVPSRKPAPAAGFVLPTDAPCFT